MHPNLGLFFYSLLLFKPYPSFCYSHKKQSLVITGKLTSLVYSKFCKLEDRRIHQGQVWLKLYFSFQNEEPKYCECDNGGKKFFSCSWYCASNQTLVNIILGEVKVTHGQKSIYQLLKVQLIYWLLCLMVIFMPDVHKISKEKEETEILVDGHTGRLSSYWWIIRLSVNWLMNNCLTGEATTDFLIDYQNPNE